MNKHDVLLSVENDTEEKIKMVEALERLEKNKDFQKVILDGYMKDEVLRANSLLANHTIKAQGKRTDIIEMLVAVSTFGEYLETIRALGASARYQKANPVSTEE